MFSKKMLLAAGVAMLAISGAANAAALDEQHVHGAATAPAAAGTAAAVTGDVVRDATDLPPPITRRNPETVRVNLETTEVTGKLDDGTTYHYWTFNGKVPGPFVRVRVATRSR